MVSLFSKPISSDPPPQIYARVQHNQPPVGSQVWGPIQTNNCFNNLLLDNQSWPVWTLPYLLWVARDGNSDHGMSLNHTERNQIVFGPPEKNPPQYYFNPPKIRLFTFTGPNWNNIESNVVSISKLSATVKITRGEATLVMPLVLGMGFVTGTYYNETPVISSSVGVQEMRQEGLVNGQCAKYWIKLFDQRTWTIYVSEDPGNMLSLSDNNHIVASRQSTRITIQICKGDSLAFDSVCGIYPLTATISGEVDRNSRVGRYSINYSNNGFSSSGKGLVWALPHQYSSFAPNVLATFTGLTLDSATNGVMRGYNTDSLSMELTDLPFDIGFDPWTSVPGFGFDWNNYNDDVKNIIREAARTEAQDDILGKCDLDLMYFGGKQLDKYAYIAYVAHSILGDQDILNSVLPRVKLAIEKYARNFQKYPLCYDDTWKGVISTAKSDADFGNSNYNDHHFHYGYHIHAIALVAAIEPEWLSANSNLVKDYALTLIRDYANPVDNDPYFPQWRNFDWYHGHSFAHGIFPSGDGKNQESSSEDYHSVHALKLYGMVTGDEEMEMSANLMLGIMRNSMNRYYLYLADNEDEPGPFIQNKVAGIWFENKIDYATFFGRGTIGDEFVHGIHMIPVTQVSSYIRGPTFVAEEWNAKLAGIVDRIPNGWRGLLKLNQGLFDPRASWQWFAGGDWNRDLIDDGMSRTWSLAYLAGIGGAR
ncbi:hypothetical protein PUMCH_004927 [Australozyma saopauloensis]|uniref:glucan endo-1,3-beta-D-glucosidase n=1 Tax=Australozyma saopauloensis TaxID=291208 RepID=A0AAX4HG02_9ASCO|nr:hypothetical protein PUMCH_004927 [[Candida] saopauloensis]